MAYGKNRGGSRVDSGYRFNGTIIRELDEAIVTNVDEQSVVVKKDSSDDELCYVCDFESPPNEVHET